MGPKPGKFPGQGLIAEIGEVDFGSRPDRLPDKGAPQGTGPAGNQDGFFGEDFYFLSTSKPARFSIFKSSSIGFPDVVR